ncbi:hypothetical protein IE4771_PB00361 (plasmid) [Rhizobium etli bv. mimosae str. IE4771]|uniref:Uncharacterized protein n=1 Tax=Rhizobium etli bv. mimosae str. IE4771 TaxID=1432050 RepID=A0A060I8F2_RHIET|nr:hypothetical protein IE4771_PB00361 [Rhizobium sp. IE4771]
MPLLCDGRHFHLFRSMSRLQSHAIRTIATIFHSLLTGNVPSPMLSPIRYRFRQEIKTALSGTFSPGCRDWDWMSET